MSMCIPLGQARPIDQAPVKKDREFGPCLLVVEPDGWRIGYWDGCGWYDDDGLPLRPRFFCLLPPVPMSGQIEHTVEDFLAAGGLV